MHEIPGPKRPLFPFDDEHCLPREDEKALLVGLVVVHRHGLAGVENADVETDLPEVRGAFEERQLAERPIVTPTRIPGVQDEPALTGGYETRADVLERGFGHHRP